MIVNSSGALLSRLGGVDVLSWNPARAVDGEAGVRLVNNFGDLLGPFLVERIAGATAMRSHVQTSTAPTVLLSIGSILHFAPEGAVVWGAGVNFKLVSKLPKGILTLDLRAVRGPYSARAIIAAGATAPAVFGDPALLLPRYMPELTEWNRSGRGGMLVVPNLNDYAAMSAEASARSYSTLDPRGSFKSVLREIAGSGFVIGSSLHAVAIADALGIPARFVASSAEGTLKYRDYLAGTDRPLARIAPDLDAAVELGGHAPLDVDLERLIAAFPHDLWGSAPQTGERVMFTERTSIIGSWKELLEESRPDESRHERVFVEEMLPAVVDAGRRVVIEAVDAPEGGVDEAFSACFADGYAFRVALAAGVGQDDLPSPYASYLATFDMGTESGLLRQLWLDREGPHAVMRSVRSSNGIYVFSVAVRPGSLTNEVADIEVIVQDERGVAHGVSVPVFAMYQRQWTIDLCAMLALRSDARATGVSVRLTGRSGDSLTLPVRSVAPTALSLRAYPHLSSAPAWSEEHASLVRVSSEAGGNV